MIQEFEWEKVELNGQRESKHSGCVYLTKTTKDRHEVNVFNIASELVKQLGWGDKIRVNLYRSGASMFMLSPSSTGLITLRKNGNRLRAISWKLCAELNPNHNGTELEAWVDGKNLYFKKKGEIDA